MEVYLKLNVVKEALVDCTVRQYLKNYNLTKKDLSSRLAG